MSNLAIIPARGGSKRIPGKNVRAFCGKPIIAYPIAAALESGLFEEVMVSTDDGGIADVGRSCGAVVPFMRSAASAADHAPLAAAILEVIQRYEEQGRRFDNVCCLLATAPFITSRDVVEAYGTLRRGNYDSVFPVVRFSYPIFRALRMNDARLQMFWPEHRDSRSQDLPPAFHDAGALYWARIGALKDERTLFMRNSGGIEVSELAAQDIDTEEDWRVAEMKYRMREQA